METSTSDIIGLLIAIIAISWGGLEIVIRYKKSKRNG